MVLHLRLVLHLRVIGITFTVDITFTGDACVFFFLLVDPLTQPLILVVLLYRFVITYTSYQISNVFLIFAVIQDLLLEND